MQLITGRLMADGMCLWLQDASGLQHPLEWPKDYRFEAASATVRDEKDQLVASIGQMIVAGGSQSDHPVSTACATGIAYAITVVSQAN